MSRAAASGSRSSSSSLSQLFAGYFKRSELPLYSLVFLLVPLVIFEVADAFHPSDPIAFRLLQIFFRQLGAQGRYIPALMVVGILLSWHIARKDPWSIKIETLWGMLFESWALSVPLIGLGVAFARWRIHVPLFAPEVDWSGNVILSLGAGIYEEVVFRLILMTAIVIILADVLRLPKVWSNLLMVSASAILFSLYHYLGNEPFLWRTFLFRTAAGVYFAGLFLTRGFGITSGCHIIYDVFIVSMQALAVH